MNAPVIQLQHALKHLIGGAAVVGATVIGLELLHDLRRYWHLRSM